MLSQNCRELMHILGCFQAIEIVRLLAQIQPRCPKLFPSLAVAHADAAPIVALEQHQRATEAPRNRPHRLRQPQRIAQSRDQVTSSLRNDVIGACAWLAMPKCLDRKSTRLNSSHL